MFTSVNTSKIRATFQSLKPTRTLAARLLRVSREFSKPYKIPVVTLEHDSGIESVCRVFETINSTGTRLKTFDLAVARFYPKPDLRNLWEDALNKHSILKDFDVDGEQALQVLYLAVAGREGRYPDPSRSSLLDLRPEMISQEWSRVSEALAITYKWAQAQGARPKTLPNHNVLVALAAVRSLILVNMENELWPDQFFIKRWYFSKVLQAGASQASNYRIGQDFTVLYRYLKEGVRPQAAEVRLNAEIVLKIKPSDVRYRSLQNILASTIREDLVSGQIMDMESKLHDHHIFPRNAHRKHGLPRPMLDSICNRITISAESNQKLGEAYPISYLRSLLEQAHSHGTLGGLQRRLNDCLIPGNPSEPTWLDCFSHDRFDTFCRSRAELIVQRVRQIIGDSLNVGPISEDVLVEEDDS